MPGQHWTDIGADSLSYTKQQPSATPKMPSFSQSPQANRGIFSSRPTPSTVGTSGNAPNLPKVPTPNTPAPKPTTTTPTPNADPNTLNNAAKDIAKPSLGSRAFDAVGTALDTHNTADNIYTLGQAVRKIPGVNSLVGRTVGAIPGASTAGRLAGGAASRVGIGTSLPFYGGYTIADGLYTGAARAMGWESGAADQNAAIHNPNGYAGNVLDNLNRPGRSIINFAESAPDAMINGTRQYVKGRALDQQIADRQQSAQNQTQSAMASGTATKQQLNDASIAARNEAKAMQNSRWYRPWLWGL